MMRKILLLLLAASALDMVAKTDDVFAPVEGASGAGLEPVADTELVFPAAYVEDFKVDGDMAKGVWQKARRVPEMFDSARRAEMECRSDVRILYSKSAIYVGATLWQDMAKMTARYDQRDMPVWNDDSIEVLLFVPSENGNRLCRFVLNPINSFTDLRDGDKSYWVPGNKHATKRFDDRWTLELKLPFAGIPMDRPVAGDFIGVRFGRKVHAPKRAFGSSPALLGSGDNSRTRFAKLLFAKPEGREADRIVAEGETYRKEALRARFYSRFGESKARFWEVCGSAAAFAGSKHPLHEKARAGIRQMEHALGEFEKRFAADLAAEREIPSAEADAILAQFAGFWAFASEHAYMVWETDPWECGSPRDLPPEDAPAMPKSIMFEQAGNEREAVCLNISGILCGSRLDLRLWPKSVERQKASGFISADNFEIWSEPFVRFGAKVITAPHSRAPGNIVTITPGQTVRVWVMFNSRGVGAGAYKTRLLFKSAHELAVADRNVDVGVKVWNFTLPETRDWPIKGFFWGPWSFAEDEVALLELTHSYHVTHGWTQKHRYQYGMYDDWGWYRKPDKGKGTVDKSHDFDDDLVRHANDAFLRRAKELGMRIVVGWGTPHSVEWFKEFSKRLLDMGFGYDDFVFHGLLNDEFTRAAIPGLAAEREAVRAWNTNLTFMATYLSTPPPTGATMDDIEAAKLPEFFKQWAVINGRCRDPKEGPDTIGRLRAKGCKVWTYSCQQFMVRRSILGYYRFYPWDAYMRGLDGFAFWTGYSPHGDDGWDSRDGFDEGLTWRGIDKKPTPTKMLEAVREGLEDVAYMDALEKALAAERAAGRDHPEWGKLLADREAIIKSSDQKMVDQWRLAVGRAIDSLSERAKK